MRQVLSQRTGFAGDLLHLTALDQSGVAVLDDGQLSAAVEIRPLDPLRMNEDEHARTTRALGRVAQTLPAGQAIKWLAISHPYNPTAVVTEIEYAARATHEHYVRQGHPETGAAIERLARVNAAGVMEHAGRIAALQTRFYVVIGWKPISRGTLHRHAIAGKQWEEARREHRALVNKILSLLRALDLSPRILTGSEYGRLLADQLTLGTQTTTVPPDFLCDLESSDFSVDRSRVLSGLIAGADVDDSHRDHLLVGGVPVQTRVLTSVPDFTYAGWLMHLMTGQYPFTLSVRWEAGQRDTEKRRARTRYKRLMAAQRLRQIRNVAYDPDTEERNHEGRRLLDELSGTAGAGIYKVSITLTLTNPALDPNLPDPDAAVAAADDLSRYSQQLERDLLGETDAFLHHPRGAQLNAWRSTWALPTDPLGLARKYSSSMVSRTAAPVASQIGSETGLLIGWSRPGRSPQFLDPYDPAHPNHLGVVCGGTGGGKTMTVIQLIADAMTRGATVTVIDRSGVTDGPGHYDFLASLIPGAAVVPLGVRDGVAVNPWDVDDPGDVPTSKVEFLLAFHAFFLGRRFPDGTYDLPADVQSQLSRAITQVYKRAALFGDVPRERMLQEVLFSMASEKRDYGDHSTAELITGIAEALHDYVGTGAGAWLADHPTNVPEDAPLVVFDTKAIADSRLGAAMFTVVEYLTRRGERTRREQGSGGPWTGRNILVIDEGWRMLERRSTASWLSDQARRSRHAGLFMIVISQQLKDFLQYPEGEVLVTQSSFRISTRQKAGAATPYQELFGYTDEELERVRDLETYKGQYAEIYFDNGTRGRGLVESRAGTAQYWYATSEPHHDQPLREQTLREAGGDSWEALAVLAEHQDPLRQSS